jgi:hypothetical protein
MVEAKIDPLPKAFGAVSAGALTPLYAGSIRPGAKTPAPDKKAQETRAHCFGTDFFDPPKVVPGVGVEPTRLSSVDFESTASANSATRAQKQFAKRRSHTRGVHANFSAEFFERSPPRRVFPRVGYPFFLGSS